MSPAVGSLLHDLRPRLLRACRGYLGERAAEAADIVQDACRWAASRLDPEAAPEKTSGWLLQHCRQLCGERLRCRSGIVRGMEGALERSRRNSAVEKVDSLNLGVQKQHWIWVLREAIKPMSLSGRQVLQLRHVKGLTYAQIAETLDIAWSEVSRLLDDAHLELLVSIGPEAEAPLGNLTRGPWGMQPEAAL